MTGPPSVSHSRLSYLYFLYAELCNTQPLIYVYTYLYIFTTQPASTSFMMGLRATAHPSGMRRTLVPSASPSGHDGASHAKAIRLGVVGCPYS